MGGGLPADCGEENIRFSTSFGTVLNIKNAMSFCPRHDTVRKFCIVLLLLETNSDILKSVSLWWHITYIVILQKIIFIYS